MSQADVASEGESFELPGMETRSKLKRAEAMVLRRAFPTWAQNKYPDGEEVLHTAFMGKLRTELQQRLSVEDQKLPLKALFTRVQYFEAADIDGGQEATKYGCHRTSLRATNNLNTPRNKTRRQNPMARHATVMPQSAAAAKWDQRVPLAEYQPLKDHSKVISNQSDHERTTRTH